MVLGVRRWMRLCCLGDWRGGLLLGSALRGSLGFWCVTLSALFYVGWLIPILPVADGFLGWEWVLHILVMDDGWR